MFARANFEKLRTICLKIISCNKYASTAKIAYNNESQQTCRIGLLTFVNELELRIVRGYIFDRQTEILNEIQQMNSALL